MAIDYAALAAVLTERSIFSSEISGTRVTFVLSSSFLWPSFNCFIADPPEMWVCGGDPSAPVSIILSIDTLSWKNAHERQQSKKSKNTLESQ
jgi:hypothetical protein